MAAKRVRRWYQFSLRALLLLLFVSSIPPGIYVGYQAHLEAKRRAEIEASFHWLESLGYPDVSSAGPVHVTTKHWQGEDASQASSRDDTVGFLISEDAKSFTVLTPALRSVSFQRETRDAWMNGSSGFEPADLRAIARQALEERLAKDIDPFPRFDDLSMRGQLFVLAWGCWRQGHIGLGKDLYAAAEAESSWYHQGDLPPSLVERLAADFAHMETWRATVDCGTQLPRPELLQKFRWIQKHFPKSKHAPEVAAKVAIFESMVAEDERHARERAAGVPFKDLSQSEQIAELIFQLRDQNGQQHSQPGSCDVLDAMSGRGDSPGHRLVEFGYDAMPQLAAALGDERLTRSVGFHRNFYFSHHVLTVGDAARQLLERIASREFDSSGNSESQTARVAAMQKSALAWHAELAAKGERAVLVEAIERADCNSVSLAHRLMKKHPDAVCTAILSALGKVENSGDRAEYIHLLSRIANDESLPALWAELRHKWVVNRVAAAEALTALHRSEGIDEMLREWRNVPSITDAEGVGPFLARCGRPEAVEAVARRFAEQSIDQRLKTMDQATEYPPETFAARPELRKAVVNLLLLGLRDTDVRAGMSIGWGDKSIADPRVCDLAGDRLHDLDPAAFPLDLFAPYAQRERERMAILETQATHPD